MAVNLYFLTRAYPPLKFPRSIQISRLTKYSRHPITVVCDDCPAAEGDMTLLEGVGTARVCRVAQRSKMLSRGVGYFSKFLSLDREIFWSNRAARSLVRLVDKKVPGVIVTFSQPISNHLSGLQIKKNLGLPWLAHFSDPWTDNIYARYNRVSKCLHSYLENRVFQVADGLIFTSEELVGLLKKRYPSLSHKMHYLPHCYDSALFKAVAASVRDRSSVASSEFLVFRYLGDFYGKRSPEILFQAVESLCRSGSSEISKLRIEFYGRPWREDLSVKYPLSSRLIRQYPSVSYKESLRLMTESDALILIDAQAECSLFFPSKLVDYIGADKPILAITPEGTAASIARSVGGVVVPLVVDEIAKAILLAIGKLSIGSGWCLHGRSCYSADSVVGRFDELICSLV